MLVIGVAEPENPNIGQEVDSQRRHEAHEESIGLKLACSAKFCVEAVGIFGVNGLRERILVRNEAKLQNAITTVVDDDISN